MWHRIVIDEAFLPSFYLLKKQCIFKCMCPTSLQYCKNKVTWLPGIIPNIRQGGGCIRHPRIDRLPSNRGMVGGKVCHGNRCHQTMNNPYAPSIMINTKLIYVGRPQEHEQGCQTCSAFKGQKSARLFPSFALPSKSVSKKWLFSPVSRSKQGGWDTCISNSVCRE